MKRTIPGFKEQFLCIYVKSGVNFFHAWISRTDKRYKNIVKSQLGDCDTTIRLQKFDVLANIKNGKTTLRGLADKNAIHAERISERNSALKRNPNGILYFVSDCGNFGYDQKKSQINLEKSHKYFSYQAIGINLENYVFIESHENIIVELFLKISKLNAQRFLKVGNSKNKQGDFPFWCEKLIPGSYQEVLRWVRKLKPRDQNEDDVILKALVGFNKFSKTANTDKLPRDNGLALLIEIINRANLLENG